MTDAAQAAEAAADAAGDAAEAAEAAADAAGDAAEVEESEPPAEVVVVVAEEPDPVEDIGEALDLSERIRNIAREVAAEVVNDHAQLYSHQGVSPEYVDAVVEEAVQDAVPDVDIEPTPEAPEPDSAPEDGHWFTKKRRWFGRGEE